MLSLPFSVDQRTRIRKSWNDDDGTITVHTEQDVEDIIDCAREDRNAHEKHTPYGELSRVASIPLTIYFDLKRQGIIDDDKRFKKWLNDSDNLAFRTRPGKV